MTDVELVPFRVAFAAEAVDDLRRRLRNTRWPERETVDDWSQGIPLAVVQELAAYWCDEYDFAAAEDRLNAWPQFTTRIDDLDIHFIHARSAVPDAMPLVITHGWPGSVAEFEAVLGPLADPVAYGGDAADAFHVVCPSLPGYGFSDRPTTRGRGVPWIANAWATLMSRLGYERFAAQGGDWGSAVTCSIAASVPERLYGIHVNMPTVALGPLADDATDVERRAVTDYDWHQQWGTGYQLLQSTRPQTLGYGLADSPVGQLAWIVEKFWAWSDCGDDLLGAFTPEQLLDNVTVFWCTNTGASSGRLYWESAGPAAFTDEAVVAMMLGSVIVPTGVSIFPREIRRPSRRWAETRFENLHWWHELDRGGHFAAFEVPELFVDEVRASFRNLR